MQNTKYKIQNMITKKIKIKPLVATDLEERSHRWVDQGAMAMMKLMVMTNEMIMLKAMKMIVKVILPME